MYCDRYKMLFLQPPLRWIGNPLPAQVHWK